MFPLIRGWTDVQRSPGANMRLGLVLSFVAGATNAGGFMAVGRYTSHMTGIVSSVADDLVLGFLLGGLFGGFGFNHVGYVTTVPLAGLLWLLSLRPLLDDLRQRVA